MQPIKKFTSLNQGKLSSKNFDKRMLCNKKLIKKPQMSNQEFLKIAKNSYLFLKKNQEKIIHQKNESGFVRVNIPVTNLNLNNIEKVRLNFWPADPIFKIIPESIHDHPRYFESLIIQGGYKHALYKIANDKLQPQKNYQRFTIFKNGNVKNFLYSDITPLQLIGEKVVKKNSM